MLINDNTGSSVIMWFHNRIEEGNPKSDNNVKEGVRIVASHQGKITYLLVRYQSGGPKISVYHLTVQSEGVSQPKLVLNRFPVLTDQTFAFRKTILKIKEHIPCFFVTLSRLTSARQFRTASTIAPSSGPPAS